MKDRVSVEQLNICEQIQHFATCQIMAEDVSKNSIQDLCDIYGFDSTVVARELSVLRRIQRCCRFAARTRS